MAWSVERDGLEEESTEPKTRGMLGWLPRSERAGRLTRPTAFQVQQRHFFHTVFQKWEEIKRLVPPSRQQTAERR